MGEAAHPNTGSDARTLETERVQGSTHLPYSAMLLGHPSCVSSLGMAQADPLEGTCDKPWQHLHRPILTRYMVHSCRA